MTTVRILALEGALRSSVALTLDVLETANAVSAAAGRGAAFTVEVDTVDGTGAPTAAASPDVVVLPGLGMTTEQQVIRRVERSDAERAAEQLLTAAAAGAALATSCSGTFLFARAGLLDGRRATTTWWLAPVFARMHPEVTLVSDDLVVRDGTVTTAGAAVAQLDLMLHVVSQHASPSLAAACARYLAFDERSSQSPFLHLGVLSAADEDVARARSWGLANLSVPIGVEDLAESVNMSPRTFARRVHAATGLPPVRFLRRLRAERAAELLRTTALPVDRVAAAVGYGDASALRRAMKAELGRGPRGMRSIPGVGGPSATA